MYHEPNLPASRTIFIYLRRYYRSKSNVLIFAHVDKVPNLLRIGMGHVANCFADTIVPYLLASSRQTIKYLIVCFYDVDS